MVLETMLLVGNPQHYLSVTTDAGPGAPVPSSPRPLGHRTRDCYRPRELHVTPLGQSGRWFAGLMRVYSYGSGVFGPVPVQPGDGVLLAHRRDLGVVEAHP